MVSKRYLSHLESDLATKVTATSERAISQQDTPGLYQVLYQVDGDAEGVHEDVSPLTAPDIAFMTKVLGMNLTAIWVRLMIGASPARPWSKLVTREPPTTTPYTRPTSPTPITT